MKNITLIAGILVISVLSGCANVPNEIDVAKNADLVAFDKVSANIIKVGPSNGMPQAHSDLGKKARWGGKIVAVENKKDVSEIEIIFFPENSYGKPKTGMPSAGRFKAVVEGFVDPLVFEQGRLITVVGEVGDGQSGIIGEQAYLYPTLNAMGYYMWKESTDINVELDTFGFSPFGYRSHFHSSFFNPWYDPWYSRHQRTRIRVERYNGHSQGATVTRSTQPSGATRRSVPSSSVNKVQRNRSNGDEPK